MCKLLYYNRLRLYTVNNQLGSLTAYEYGIGRIRWNEPKSVSFDSRKLRNDFPWKRHVWEMASSSRYCGATRLKKKPEIFRCTASWRIALSAMLFSHGMPSCVRNVKRLCLEFRTWMEALCAIRSGNALSS